MEIERDQQHHPSVRQAVTIALVLAIVGLPICCSLGAPVATDIATVFKEGCDLYEQGDFASAAERFEDLSRRQVTSADVYYNLGNCYYKQGHAGKAVVNYRRALMLSPRDDDIRANLSLLRSVVGFRDTTASYDLSGIATFPLQFVSARELQLAFYVGYYLTAVCFVCALMLSGTPRERTVRILVAVLLVTVGALALARHGQARFSSGSAAVITAEGAEFMSGPGTAFDELARLPDGVEVRLRAKSGVWVEVELGTGDIGWVREKDLEKI